MHTVITPTHELRHEHEIILRALKVAERLGRRLAAGQPMERERLAAVVELFQTFADRCHHGKEEQHLFPMLEARGVPVEGGPIGTMLEEHETGRRLIGQMAGGPDEQVAQAIQRYATLLRAHIDKENHILLPLADEMLGEDEQRRLTTGFEAIERELVGPGAHERLERTLAELEAVTSEANTLGVLDVRDVPARERHPRIFGTFEALRPGEAFVLVNDHDPRPLYYQFAAEQPGRFDWAYQDEGPEVWRVRIRKIEA